MWVTYGKSENFFGMLTKRLASMSKKFLALLARARLGKRVFFLRGLELKKVRVSLQQHEPFEVHKCEGCDVRCASTLHWILPLIRHPSVDQVV